jgi:hypothetical protein
MKTRFLLTIVSLAVTATSLRAEIFACDLKALAPEERKTHQKLSMGLGSAITARQELPDGYTFQIDSAKLAFVDVARWIAFEHRCCRFLLFRLEMRGTDGNVSLSLQGAPGVKKFIETEFRFVRD